MSDKKDKIEEQEELNTESANVENPETEQEPELTCLLYTSPSPRDRLLSRMTS